MTLAELKTSARKLTAEEFLELPLDDADRRELVNGEIVVSPRPTRAHNFAAFELARILAAHLDLTKAASLYLDVDNVFDAGNVRAPDIILYPPGAITHPQRPAATVPLLCVEVISPSSARTDRVEKFKLYESRGVAHYWIVDPIERTFEAYSLLDQRYIPSGRGAAEQVLKVPPFAELDIPLARLWHP
jgi:Uma2 family endonuclease